MVAFHSGVGLEELIGGELEGLGEADEGFEIGEAGSAFPVVDRLWGDAGTFGQFGLAKVEGMAALAQACSEPGRGVERWHGVE